MDMTPPPIAEETDAERLARQQAVLRELTELGMRMARALCEEVEAAAKAGEPQPQRAADPALMFSRISRAVRLTLALETKLIEDAQAGPARRETQAADRKAQAIRGYEADRARAVARKETVVEVVETVIDFDAPENDIESLLERSEVLLDPDEDAKFADAPLSVWITAICKDLGLTPDWNLWAAEDWAAEEAVTWPDSPFAKLYPRSSGPPPGRSPDRGRWREAPEGAEAHSGL